MSESDNNKLLFQCKTDGSYQIKVISEILHNVVKMGFFEINSNGIFLSMFDQSRKTMVMIELLAENFSSFVFNSNKPLFIGINTSHMFRVLKSNKKKDSIELMIYQANQSELLINTTPKDCNRVSVSVIKIQSALNLDISKPEGYVNKSIILPSNDFNKAIKDLIVIGSDVLNIESGKDFVRFVVNANSIIKRSITFGTVEQPKNEPQTATFAFELIDRISKLSCFNNPIHVYASSLELPLQFKTAVGSLGTIRIFVKSNELLAAES
jgi:hypothetical protein